MNPAISMNNFLSQTTNVELHQLIADLDTAPRGHRVSKKPGRLLIRRPGLC